MQLLKILPEVGISFGRERSLLWVVVGLLDESGLGPHGGDG
jgi:hypothetical protein